MLADERVFVLGVKVKGVVSDRCMLRWRLVSGGALREVLKEVKLVRQKVERLEEIVEERLIGVEEPSEDEAEAIEQYVKAKKKGSVELVPLEDVGKEK